MSLPAFVSSPHLSPPLGAALSGGGRPSRPRIFEQRQQEGLNSWT